MLLTLQANKICADANILVTREFWETEVNPQLGTRALMSVKAALRVIEGPAHENNNHNQD